MHNKMLINLRAGIDISDLQSGDILVYDNIQNDFYIVTPETFFDKYEEKLNDLLNRYDESNKQMKEEISVLRSQYNEFANSIKKSNEKLIDMVEKFTKEGK